MSKDGIVNPHLLSLLARVRHTNTVVIADRGFPYWPMIETVDISLCDDIPTVINVLEVIIPRYNFGRAFMAEEFKACDKPGKLQELKNLLGQTQLVFEPHEDVFEKRVPNAIGFIRTGDTTQYANIILESA